MIWLIYAQVVRLEQVRAAARTPFAPDDVHEWVALCVEINQCVGYLAPSSGEEPASPRHRAGVASMAWRTTR